MRESQFSPEQGHFGKEPFLAPKLEHPRRLVELNQNRVSQRGCTFPPVLWPLPSSKAGELSPPAHPILLSHKPPASSPLLLPSRGPSASSAIFPPLVYLTNSSFPSKLGHVSSTVTVTLSRLAEFFHCIFHCIFMLLLLRLSYFIYYIICHTALQLFAYNFLSIHLFLLF